MKDKNTKLTSDLNYTPVDTPTYEESVEYDKLSKETVGTSGNKQRSPKTPIDWAKTRYRDQFWFYKNDTIIGRSIELYGEYTEPELMLIRQFVDRESVIYDVGSNIGYHAIGFASMAKHVYCFEPNKKHLDLLYKNTSTFDNITIYPEAVSDKTGTITVEDFDINQPGNYGECYVGRSGYEVDTVTIDQLDDIWAPDLIKIDVEGHELPVLMGAKETIKEFHPHIFYEAHGTDLDEIYDFLRAYDYNLYWYPCYNFNENNFNNNKMNIFGMGGVLNIFAIHGNTITNLIPYVRGQSWEQARQELLNKLKEENNG